MEELPHAPSKRMYSWWWDSHISPKNSKWLQENLNDMDSKVKAMIKLIEEDADSFARRAEMYYKKRPELMKLVEEFYRAYRALAERYDNVTGVLRQAQRTMAEAFPNQDPLEINDNIPENKTPEIHEKLLDLLGEEKVRKGLEFCEDLSESEMVSKFENEIRELKGALAQLELEKEAGIIQYENSLEKMSKLESEFSRAWEVSRELNDRTNFAEGGVQVLRDSLNKLAAEKETSFLEYQKSLEKITNLEKNVFQAKEEVVVLNEKACKAESEKDEALNKYKQSLENVLNFEKKIKVAEQDAKQLSERAENAEKEVETLKQEIAKLTEENEFNILQYRKCLEKISNLEHELSCAEEEAQRLKNEIEFGVTKLKNKEEMCLTLEKSNQALDSELGSLVLKMGSQTEKLSEKERELGKIWSSLQEERNRFIRAENNFEKLQKLHLQTQDQLKSLGSELEKKGELLKEIETRNESLSNEISRIIEENKSLNECNLFSSMTIKDMQSEISGLIKSKNKLLKEAEMRMEQRIEMEECIHSMDMDIIKLSEKNRIILEQVEAVGLNPKNFESSVKQLQTENSDLKEIFEKEKAKKLLVLRKMETMEQLFEKNELLEKSFSDLTDELEKSRGKISSLEQSFEALLVEKSVILGEKKAVMSQLQAIIETFEKYFEKNICLENSLSDTFNKLEGSRARSKTLEDSYESLEKENFYLIKEKDSLVSQGETTKRSLEDLGKRQMELEDKHSGLEKEGELTFSKLEKFRFSLDLEKNDHSNFAYKTETQLSGMEKQIYLLQEEVFSRRKEFEQELDKVINYQLEIFILRNCLNNLKENNSYLLEECQKLTEASKISEYLISELKHENIGKQAEIKSLSDKINMFNMGMHELSEAIRVDLGHPLEDDLAGDQRYLKYMLSKLEENKNENQRLNIKICVMKNSLMQLRLHANTLVREREILDKELNNKNEDLLLSQNEAKKLLELNGDLNLKVSELTSQVTMMKTEIDKINMVSNNRENQFHKLSEENVCLHKEKNDLGIKMKKLNEELGLKNELWDGELETMFGEMQYSTVFQVLLENNFFELKKVINSKDEQIEVLEGKIGYLEGENGRLETQLAAYSPLIISLKDSISSLESRTLRYKLQKSHNEGAKEKNEISDEKVLDAYSELKDMLFKIKVIERLVAQKERLVAQENLNSNTKLEAAKKSIDGFKIKGCANREYSVPIYDNSEFEDDITMKDIVLDKNSESSSHKLSKRGERKHRSKRVESWDLADLDRSIDLTIGRDKRVKSSSEPLKREKNKYRNMDIEAEKELGVDKLEISRTFSQRSQEANKTKIMERLNSDAEKLNNLEITVQDMRKKVEITENGKKGKAVYVSDTLREKLEEAEEAIIELFDFNGKLMRSVVKRSFSSNLKLGVDSEESGSGRRRRIAEQVRKVSEKIGRWQMEVQKIQILVMKNEKEIKNKCRGTEVRKRILLRDYLYGGLRTPSHELGRKKSSFCGFVRPSIRGD